MEKYRVKKKYRFLFFDLDRTLWDFETNAHDAVVELLREYDLQKQVPDAEQFYSRYKEHNQHLWEEYEAGRLSQQVLRSLRFEITFRDFGVDDSSLAQEFGATYLERMPSKTALMPHTKEILEYARLRSCQMAIISNGFKQVQELKLERSGIRSYFSNIFISEDIGVHKPHPAIFKAAVAAFNANKADCLMIGDDFTRDIEGAQIFGIDQFFFNPLQLPCDGGPTYESDSLLLIKELV